MKKRMMAAILTVLMILQFSLPTAIAEAGACEEFTESNLDAQDYKDYAKVKYSFLDSCDNGQLMHFNGHTVNGHYIVRYYDSDHQLVKTLNIEEELPIFGAFYAGKSYYFLLTGQENYELDDEKEIFRITRYDKNWNRIDSVGKNNCNTSKPFSNGTPSMTDADGCLLIRTSHLMYNGHQSNVTMQIGIEDMKFIFSHTHLSYVGNGYVSHSFNQFIKADEGKVVAVDHGDAFPRCVVLMNYPTLIAEGSINSFSVVSTDMVNFKGYAGDNYTGTSVGGFEVSKKSYLLAYNRIDYDDFDWKNPKQYLDKIVYLNNKPVSLTDGIETRDVCMSVKLKTAEKAEQNKYITHLNDNQTASTPYLVKVNDNRYIVLWSQKTCVKAEEVYPDIQYKGYYVNVPDKKVYYTEVDAQGNVVGKIRSMSGYLSDCQPICANGKVIWQTNKNNVNTIYSIDVYDLRNHQSISSNYTHIHSDKGTVITKATKTKTGLISYNCKVCGEYFTEVIPKNKYNNGDANTDGKINVCDATQIKKYTAGKKSTINKDYADFNQDGKINVKDVTMLQKYIAAYVVKK